MVFSETQLDCEQPVIKAPDGAFPLEEVLPVLLLVLSAFAVGRRGHMLLMPRKVTAEAPTGESQ